MMWAIRGARTRALAHGHGLGRMPGVCWLSTVEPTAEAVADVNVAVVASPDTVVASVPLAQASAAQRFQFFELSKETEQRWVPEGLNRRTANNFDLLDARHIMLRDHTLEILTQMQNWNAVKDDPKTPRAFVLDGEQGSGKSMALLQLVQFARESGWLVLYVPNARAWCHDAPFIQPSLASPDLFDVGEYATTLLEHLRHCHAEQLGAIQVRGHYDQRYYPAALEEKPKDWSSVDASKLTLLDLVENGIRDDDLACTVVRDLRAEFAKVTEAPVLIAIDEYNTWFADTIFGFDGHDIWPGQLSIVDALTDIREKGLVPERKLANGIFVAATTENFPSKYSFRKKVDYRAHRRTFQPYAFDELQHVVAYYQHVKFLEDDVSDAQLAFLRLMTKSLPFKVFDRASFS